MSEPPTIEHDPHEKPVRYPWLLYAVCLIAFGVVMGGWHILMTGISVDFGAGLVCGFAICAGALAILVKDVRRL